MKKEFFEYKIDEKPSDIDNESNGVLKELVDGLKDKLEEALGVGELPTNIATVDQDSEVGNVYTKTKTNELLEEKLDKPTTEATTTEAPFVVGVNSDNESYKLPAGDLGKNISNSNLTINLPRKHTITAGGSLEFDVNNNPFKITGLPNKVTDVEFNKVLKTNGEQIGLGNAFIYNVPDNITVNNIGINSTPEVTELVNRFKDKLTELHTSQTKRFENIYIKTLNDITDDNIKYDNGNIITSLNPFTDDSVTIHTPVISIYSDRILPMDKDWYVSFNVKMGHNGQPHYNHIGFVTNRKIGVYSSLADGFVEPSIYVYDDGGDYSLNSFKLLSSQNRRYSERTGNNSSSIIYTGNKYADIRVSIIKVGDSILLQTSYGNGGLSEVYSASSLGNGDFGFCVSVQKPERTNNSLGVISNLEYLIFN